MAASVAKDTSAAGGLAMHREYYTGLVHHIQGVAECRMRLSNCHKLCRTAQVLGHREQGGGVGVHRLRWGL